MENLLAELFCKALLHLLTTRGRSGGNGRTRSFGTSSSFTSTTMVIVAFITTATIPFTSTSLHYSGSILVSFWSAYCR